MMLADKLSQLRKKSGWSQEELADRMEVSRQAVSKWESAQSVPDLEKLLRLSRLFGVSTDYLLKDELEEAGPVSPGEPAAVPHTVTPAQAGNYLSLRQAAAKRIALGVFLCVLSPVPLLLAAGTGSAALVLAALILLLIVVAAAVALFLTTGNRSADYEFLEQERFVAEPGVTELVRAQQRAFRPVYFRCNVIAACICVLSPIPLLLCGFLDPLHELQLMLLLALTILLGGSGATLFVWVGVPWAAMQKLLQEGDYTPENKRRSRFSETAGVLYWLLATGCYLAWSFAADAWTRSWILWPVAAVLFAALLTATRLTDRQK